MLIVKRKYDPLAGQWSLPGGGVEVGETLEESVAREMLEETGLEVEVGPVIEVFDRITRDEQGEVRYHFVLVDYLCWPVGGELRAGSDVADARFVDPAELPRLQPDREGDRGDCAGARARPRGADGRCDDAVARRRLAAADGVDDRGEPAQACAGRRGGGARLRAPGGRGRGGMGHRGAAARLRLRAIPDGSRSSVSRLRGAAASRLSGMGDEGDPVARQLLRRAARDAAGAHVVRVRRDGGLRHGCRARAGRRRACSISSRPR